MIYRFDDFLLNPATRELRRSDELVALPARAFDCLAYLVEHRERAVGRDELIAAVWGRVEVSEALLSHTIVKLRRSLGDTGNEQRTVRTVPRFGYRWVGATTVESGEADKAEAVGPAADGLEAAPTGDTSPPGTPAPGASDANADAPSPVPGRRGWRVVAAIVVIVAVGAAAVLALRRARAPAPAASAAAVATPPPEFASAAPALVLPAEVDAPDDWRWLRLGLMDLVANRLRDGSVPTAPSESVVGLLKQRPTGDGETLLHDATLVQFAALRVLPRVRLRQGVWQVRLDALGVQHSLSVEAEAGDAIQATRKAADALLRGLGRAPSEKSVEPASPALEELLQHSGAAMLADQLEQARELIARAPASLQQEPRVEQRMAQIELRAGDYPAVETRLHALLDRLPAGRDDALRARAMLTLAASHVRRGQFDRALELYDEAIALRQAEDDHEALGIARLGRGSGLAQRGRFDEATAEMSRARTELETVGDGLGVASVDVNLGSFQLMQHRPADALAILKTAVRQFERLGAREGRAYALSEQVSAEAELLDVGAALATSERFWPPESNTSNQRMRWTLAATRALALLGAGRVEEAQVLVERIRREADAHRDRVARARAELLAARIALERGEAKAAASFAETALTPALRDEDASAWTRGLALRARALRADGQTAAAAKVVDTLRAWATGAGDEWRTLYATLADAEQAAAEGRREPALEQFAAAMQAAERINVPEDLVAVGSAWLDLLIEASQLDTARAVSGRIAMWADRDARAASAQARLFRALGQHDAARKAEEDLARLQRPESLR